MDWINLSRSSVNATLYDVSIKSQDTIFVFGRAGYNGIIYKTTNKGIDWNISYLDSTLNSGIYAAEFTNNSTGFAVGLNGEIIKTTTSGENWFNINYSNIAYRDITSFGGGKIIIAGANGTVIISDDLGSTWSHANTPVTSNLLGIYFINNTTGFSVGLNGTILQSTDSGKNWSAINSNTINHIYDITFFGDSIGIAVGIPGTILRSTDSGLNWTNVNPGYSDYLWRIEKINDNTCYVSGEGVILKSIDRGMNWTIEDLNYGGQLLGLNPKIL
jgi:photosystem II stability/assembly factor-like uncharacterized protein